MHGAIGAQTLRHFEPQRPAHQRHMLVEEQIIRIGPVHAADLVDVAEAFGRHQRGLGTGALEQRVDGDGRAVQKQMGYVEGDAGALDRRLDALDQRVMRRQRLAEEEPSGAFVEGGEIGEGAADIDGDPQPPALGV